MKRNKLILTVFLLTFSLARTFATAQIPDKLIYKGDTLLIFANPLEQLYDNDSSRPKFFGEKEGCMTTACWRGYQAEWTIIDDQLYLTGIVSCCFHEDSVKADLNELFGSKFINGKIKADWFVGNIIAPQGKLLFYVHMGYESLYEKELELQFKNGQLIGTKIYDNSKSRQSVYSQNQEELQKIIYSNINWTILPKLEDNVVRILIQFSANENGIVDSVKVIRGYDALFDEEAIRVVKTIPGWDIFYRHGNFQRITWTFPVIFSEDSRNRYKKDRQE